MIAELCAHWPQIIGDPALVAQRENTIYRAQTPDGVMALRLHRPGYHSAAALQSELDFMAMLAAHGMQVPRPIPDRHGHLLVPVGRGYASLLTWLPGRPLGASQVPLDLVGADRGAVFLQLGAQMARLHTLADGWTPPPGFERPAWDAAGLVGDRPLWGPFWADGRFADIRTHAAQVLADRHADTGLIHADLVRENVLIDKPDLYFIDFDDFGPGYRIFDIATALLKNIHELDFPDLQAALLTGYASIRPLPDLDILPLFMALRALTYIGWAHARSHEPGMAARAARFDATARRMIAAL